MDFPIVGGAYETFSKSLNAQQCVNWFVHVDQEGGVSQLSLRPTPGLKTWADADHFAEVRGVNHFNLWVYAVIGNRVYRFDSDANETLCSGNLKTFVGKVSMANNGSQLMIVDGLYGYTVSGTTVTKITDDSFFENPETVTAQDSYFIVSIRNSEYAYISDAGDGTSWDSTINIKKGGYSDNILAVKSDHKDLFLIGKKTYETFYNSGGDPPFSYRPGSAQEVGTSAGHAVAQVDNTLFLLTDKFQVARFEGNRPVVKSTRSVDYQIAQYEKKSDAIGMGVWVEGNAFYVLTFPTANKTWAYNAASGFWNEWKSYPNEGRWRGNCYVDFDGIPIVGDYENGKLYKLDFDTYTDNSEMIRRVRIPSAVRQMGKKVFHYQLEVFFESGVGTITGQGSDPQAMLQYSDDGGQTWSNELWRSAGKIGKYGWRAVWNRLGASRHRNYRLVVTDPVKWVITGANLEAEIGRT